MSSRQSEERTMLFTREKSDTCNQNHERYFFTCEKNDTSNQKPQQCVRFVPKFPPVFMHLQLAVPSHWELLCRHSEEKTQGRVFLVEKGEKSRKLDWNGFVYFTIDEEYWRELGQNKGERGKTQREVSLYLNFLSELSFLSHLLVFILKTGHFTQNRSFLFVRSEKS